jgi:MFS family permease
MAGVSSLAGTLVANRFIGGLADKFGATPILKFGAILAALSPVTYLWIDRAWQVWLANFGSGIAWASVNLAAFKYLVQAVRKGSERPGFVYANLWLTTTVLVMSLIGGLLAPHLPTLFTWPLQTLFLLSALARVAVVALFFARLVELEPRQHAARVYDAGLCRDG